MSTAGDAPCDQAPCPQPPCPPLSATGLAADDIAATITDYRVGSRVVATHCEVDGLGHAWSGGTAGHGHSDAKGPDASRMIWAFYARQFARA